MGTLADDLMRLYGEEDSDEDDLDLIQKTFWSDLRAELYKKICRGEGGYNQWALITGKKTRYPDGQRIRLSDKTVRYLQEVVDFFGTAEGREDLEMAGITKIPEHIDDITGMIGDALVDRAIKREQFRLFLKHKYRIMRFLLR
jgi:hypothetical protein